LKIALDGFFVAILKSLHKVAPLTNEKKRLDFRIPCFSSERCITVVFSGRRYENCPLKVHMALKKYMTMGQLH